jgi:membrane protein YdbS with pleckstrin-like domain
MIFQNKELDIQELPRVEDLNFRRLSPNYLKVGYAGNAIFFFIVLVGLSIFYLLAPFFTAWWWPFLIYGGWALLAGGSSWLIWKGYQIEGYAIREKDILHKQGVIYYRQIAIPYNRVQHMEIKEGPIEKIFNLCTLRVYTAGGQSSDLSIPGITRSEALRIKSFITKKVGADEEE